jgi:energy-converting hydrogenase Eha subunit B
VPERAGVVARAAVQAATVVGRVGRVAGGGAAGELVAAREVATGERLAAAATVAGDTAAMVAATVVGVMAGAARVEAREGTCTHDTSK